MASKARELANLGNAYSDGALSNRNLIINGAMQVAQRGTSGFTAGTSYGLDRWKNWSSGSGSFTVDQSTDVPATEPFYYSLKGTVTTNSTPSGNDYYGFAQYIEGYNTQRLGFGTSAAQPITLSFWVKSSVTGTYTVAISNQDGATRTYAADYSILSANTWEKKTVTVSGDTTGTWGKTNGNGLRVWFALGMGSTFSTSTSNAWEASQGIQSPSAIDWIATSGATFYLTGVQLEVGDTATPFEHRSYGQELALCQRYYEVCHGSIRANQYGGFIGCGVQFKQTKRAAPTLTAPVGGNNDGVSFQAYVTAGYGDYQKTAAHPQWAASSGGHTYGFEITADAEL